MGEILNLIGSVSEGFPSYSSSKKNKVDHDRRNTNLFNANSADAGQTPRVAASDLGLQCLPSSHIKMPIILTRICGIHFPKQL